MHRNMAQQAAAAANQYSCQPPPSSTFNAIDFHDISRRPRRNKSVVASSGRILSLFKLNCLLCCIGVITGLTSTTINIAIFLLSILQDNLAQVSLVGLLSSIGIDVAFVALAAALCKYIDPAAIGSGVAQMKYVLAGDVVTASQRFFTLCTGLVKVLGIVLVVAGRLNVGREGALTQIAGCIAYFLMRKVAFFGEVSSTVSQQRQLYAASAAVGIATAFHAPIGGVLFSIEVTATFYLVSNYWKAFVASISGMLCVELLQSSVRRGYILPMTIMPLLTESVDSNNTYSLAPVSTYHSSELLIFLGIGVLGGFLGCVLLGLYSIYRATISNWSKHRPILLSACSSLVTIIILYFTGLYYRSYSFSTFGLFQYDFLKLDFLVEQHSGSERSIGQYAILALSQALLTLIGTNCPVPTGTFFPMFIVGACLGRIIARAARLLEAAIFVGSTTMQKNIIVVTSEGATVVVEQLFVMAKLDPTGYAIIGGVALTASVTQAISCAVIAIEITDDINYLLPCLLVAIIASGISKLYGLSVYERAMVTSELETLPILLARSGHSPPSAALLTTSGEGEMQENRRGTEIRQEVVNKNHFAQGVEKNSRIFQHKRDGDDELSRRIYAQHALIFVHEHSSVAEYILLLRHCYNLEQGEDVYSSQQRLQLSSDRSKGDGLADGASKQNNSITQLHHNCQHFPIVDDPCTRSLSGTVSREHVRMFLHDVFASVGLVNTLYLLLLDDFAASSCRTENKKGIRAGKEKENSMTKSGVRKDGSIRCKGSNVRESRGKEESLLIRPYSVQEYVMLNGWECLDLTQRTTIMEDTNEEEGWEKSDTSAQAHRNKVVGNNSLSDQWKQERFENEEKGKNKNLNLSSSSSSSSSLTIEENNENDDDSDSDSRALFNLGLSKSASMSALNELRAASQGTISSRNTTQQRGNDYNLWRNRYGTRGDVPTSSASFSPSPRHTMSQKQPPESFSARSIVPTEKEVAAKCHSMATAAEETCRKVLMSSSRIIDTLVDWRYVNEKLQLISSNKNNTSHLGQQNRCLSSGTHSHYIEAIMLEQLQAAFKDELFLSLSQQCDQTRARHGTDQFQEEIFAEEEVEVDKEARRKPSCAKNLAETLLTLLRSPVQLTSSSRTMPTTMGNSKYPVQNISPSQGIASSSSAPVFYCPSPPASAHAAPPLAATLWPNPASIGRDVSLLAQRGLALVVDRSPFAIPAFLPLERLCILMEMLQSTEQFVTDPSRRGALVGLVTREGLLATLREMLAEQGKCDEKEDVKNESMDIDVDEKQQI